MSPGLGRLIGPLGIMGLIGTILIGPAVSVGKLSLGVGSRLPTSFLSVLVYNALVVSSIFLLVY